MKDSSVHQYLADTRYGARDTQYLLGRLVDATFAVEVSNLSAVLPTL